MLKTLENALQEQVRDLYSAENQLVRALPKMAEHATSESLRNAITSHLEETKGHVERLEKISELLEVKPSGKKCKAMEGLIEEASEALKEHGQGPVIDIAMIAAAQRVEHYEIAAYGSARAMAETLGRTDVAELLQETLDEEGAADKKLTQISQDEILQAAADANGGAGQSKRAHR